ncbi:hypothetical protein CL614_10685 [archaeon]|nr:hypothetical protein [archaeon]
MAFQVSPGVNVSEIDATNVVPAVSTSDAGFAAAFVWGPADKITTIASEVALVDTFGKPDSDTQTNWYTAASFLAYAGSLQVVRTLGAAAYNSSDGTAAATEGVIVDFETTITSGGNSYTDQNTESLTGGTGSGATGKITVVGGAITAITIVAGGTGYNSGDVLTVATGISGTVTVETVTGTSSAGILVKNEEDFDGGATTGTATFVARYAGALGNSIQVDVFHASSGNLSNWKEDFYQNGSTTTVDFGALVDRAPTTSDYVLNNNGGTVVNDEIHVAVVDYDGQISGKAGEVLETYTHLSLSTDAKDAQGNSNYYKDVIRRDSRYVYATGNWDNVGRADWESKSSTGTTAFSDVGGSTAISIKLADGEDDDDSSSGGGNHSAKRYSATTGYGLFVDKEAVDIDLLPIGVDSSGALAILVIDNIAKIRKDCIVFLSPDSASVIGTGITKAADVVTDSTQTGLSSTSYAVMDSGWKRTYNRYTDKYIDIPLNGDVAGLCVSVDNSLGAWWSPAGLNRGAIRNVVKLHFDPNKTERDTLYKANINPVANISGAGTILYGDKTFLKKPSAFDRINVRRLFNLLERTISSAAKYMLFEFNDEFTRSSFRNMVEPFLSGIKAKRGIYDFKVVCDSSNNTSDVIDRNEFVGDIYIKPARSINYIQLNFIAVRTGVSFSEVAG